MSATKRCWRPIAVALVTSGSRGNRLLFFHKGQAACRCAEGLKDVISELPPRTLAEVLAPSPSMVDRKFELSVDEWKFVGHPFSVQSDSFSISFNVVFVLQSYCRLEIVLAYDHLSHLIGSAMVHEENKSTYLNTQFGLLMQLLEEADIPDPSAEDLLAQSSLAGGLHSVLCSLQEGRSDVQVRVNDWSEVHALLVPFQAHTDVIKPVQPACVRSYSALLLLEGSDQIAASLPPSCNPAVHRMLQVVSPMKNLQEVSLDADVPLLQVLHLASHLVTWKKAIAIYPLSESNVYISSATAVTTVDSKLFKEFSRSFPHHTLGSILSNFSLPISLGELKQQLFLDESIVRIVAWLLRHTQIVQLHTYVYIVPSVSPLLVHPPPPPSSSSPPSSGLGSDLNHFNDVLHIPDPTSSTGGSVDSGHAESGVGVQEARLLQPLSPAERELWQALPAAERHHILDTAAAYDSHDLKLFARLSQYFHGNHHLEEIMLIENIARSQLLTLIDKFSEVLVTCSLSQNTPPLLKDN